MITKTIGQLTAASTAESVLSKIEVESTGGNSRYATVGNDLNCIPLSNGVLNTGLDADTVSGYGIGPSQVVSADATLVVANSSVIVTTADEVDLTLPDGFAVGTVFRISRTVASHHLIQVLTNTEHIEGAHAFTTHGEFVGDTGNLGVVTIKKVTATTWFFVDGVVSGSNTNGSWIKFGDGTMECWGIVEQTNYTFAATTNIFTAQTATFTIPQNFIDTNYVMTGFATNTISDAVWLGQDAAKTVNTNRFYFCCHRSGTYSVGFEWRAIGRWKA